MNFHRQIFIDKHWPQNDLTEELSDFQLGTVIGCHLSNKSIQISALLELPRSNCKCSYCKLETSRSNNDTDEKW
jgi:biotin synthase-like enzyme